MRGPETGTIIVGLLRRVWLEFLYFTGCVRFVEWWRAGAGVILKFDRVRPLQSGPFQPLKVREITPQQFERLLKRLRRHRDDLFTFLDEPDVPFDNNHAERAIRPAVMIRKNSFGNRSDRGADTQAVLMSVYRTIQQRGHAPLKTIVDALTTYLATGQLPPLPSKAPAVG